VRAAVLVVAGCGRAGFGALAPIDAGPDATIVVPDGPVPVSACGSTVLLSESFDTGAGPTWAVTNNSGLTASEINGNEEIDFAASVGAGEYAFFRSNTMYTVDGLCAQAEIAGTPDFARAGAAIYFKLRTNSDEVEFFAHDGVLDLRTHVAGKVTVAGTIVWDASALRFERLRHQAGVTYWDTSADGVIYTQQLGVAGFEIATAQLELGAGAAKNVTNGGTALFASALAIGP